MAKPLSILFVASEVFPFAKVGGIADVAYSYPLSARELNHDIRVMLPKYGAISERKNRIHEINRLKDMQIPLGKESELATVKSSSINNPRVKVQTYITTNYKYFDAKKGIYHDPKTWVEYPDNDERFAFFNRTVIETCLTLGWFPDIIHCNGWQTGLIPAYVKLLFPKEFKKTKLVFTIHNFREQGAFPNFDFSITGLPKEAKNIYRYKNIFNFMKGALELSDFITTVSPSYAEEILKDKISSDGLNSLLKEKGDKFVGIQNGIDHWGWNPKTDEEIPFKLDNDFEEFKYNNKVALINKFGLEYKPSVPLIGMISRLDYQKGVSLLIEAAEKILKENIQLVILGEGDPELHSELNKLSKRYPKKFKIKYEYNEQLAHLIEAGSDMFLITSVYEPCGLNLMYSLNYGAVPIVHYTGGLKDVAVQFDAKTKTGNSFVYTKHNQEELLNSLREAIKAFHDKELWHDIIENGRREDFHWLKPAKQYDEIYRNLMKDVKLGV